VRRAGGTLASRKSSSQSVGDLFVTELGSIGSREFVVGISTPSVVVSDIIISGFCGHIAISGCRLLSKITGLPFEFLMGLIFVILLQMQVLLV